MTRPALLLAACILLVTQAHAQGPQFELIKPSAADPRIKNFDENNIVVRPAKIDGAPLVVYFPGTGGTPDRVRTLLGVVAGQGYRVIGLYYDDTPAVQQVCPTVPDPECAAKFRAMRIYGTSSTGAGGPLPATNPPEETIVTRLVMLLTYLDTKYPAEHWGEFLGPDKKPVWSKIVVSGLSQGAGMAAFIAKKEKVARVVLFSSPVDMLGGITGTKLAPWLTWPSATPAERWYAERNSREPFNPGLIKSYPALGIPADHIRVFDHDLPPGRSATSPMAYHGINVLDAGYTPEWKLLFGTAAELK